MSTVPTDRPPPPPGLIYPPPAPPPESSPSAIAPIPPAGYARSCSIVFTPRMLGWVPALGLTLIFLLTMVPWVGSYVGGNAVYTQNPWRAGFGGAQSKVNRNFELENLMKQRAGWPDTVIDKVSPDRGLMIPFLLVLTLAGVIAWAERLFVTLNRTQLPRRVGWIADVWPYRIPVLAGLATVAVLLVLIQSTAGFGLERAMQQVVSERFAEERKQNADSPSAQAAIDFKEDQELARFNLERTTWFYLAIALNILVVLAMVIRGWLDRRGNKPPPRIVFQY